MHILAVICMFFFLACGSESDKCAKNWPGFKQASIQNLTHKFDKYQDGDPVSVTDCYLRYRGAVMYSGENWLIYEVFGSSRELCESRKPGEKRSNFILLTKHLLPPDIELVNTAGIWKKNIRLGGSWSWSTDAIIVQKISYWNYLEGRCVTIEW